MEESKKPTQTKLYQRLIEIQNELKAPKGRYNTFGKYAYRSAEDILESLKPLLKKHGVAQVINDDIVLIGDRFYIKATVTLFDDKETLSTTAFAREENERKGMNGDQLTGASSSYARKYALNAMYAIDDNKDNDDTNNEDSPKKKPRKNNDEVIKQAMENNTIEKAPEAKMTPKQIAIITMYSKHFGDRAGKIALDYMKAHNVAKSKDLTETQAIELIRDLSELDNGDIVIKYESEKK